ncbi:MAG: hypothetical protein MUP04_10395 [Anaerolineae bacterium]|nr:hypothetical protein [Anaerolineae bacterium]
MENEHGKEYEEHTKAGLSLGRIFYGQRSVPPKDGHRKKRDQEKLWDGHRYSPPFVSVLAACPALQVLRTLRVRRKRSEGATPIPIVYVPTNRSVFPFSLSP